MPAIAENTLPAKTTQKLNHQEDLQVPEEKHAQEAQAKALAEKRAQEEAQAKALAEKRAQEATNTTSTLEVKEELGILADIQTQRISKKTYILKGVYFETSSSQLTDKSQRQINVIAEALKTHPDVKIRLRGHTDNRGSNAFNIKISKQRADAVKASLVSKGIQQDRIQTEGKSSTEPISDNNTKEGRLNNRRVDIAVI